MFKHSLVLRVLSSSILFFCSQNVLHAPAADSSRGIAVMPVGAVGGPAIAGDYHALIIGIDNYTQWPKLNNAVHDAREMAQVLTQSYGFSPNRIVEFYDGAATKDAILSALRSYTSSGRRALKADDNLLIFFSGHGQFDDIENVGYWISVESRTDQTGDYISNDQIKRLIGAIKTRHILLISDACFSGSLLRSGTLGYEREPDNPKFYEKVSRKASRQALTSGMNEPVMDGGSDGHSVFSYYMLKSLRENPRPLLDAGGLYEDIKVPVANNSAQTPILQPIRDVGDEGGQFVFRQSAVSVQSPVAPTAPEVPAVSADEYAKLAERTAQADADAKQKLAAEKVRREKYFSAMDDAGASLQKIDGSVSMTAADKARLWRKFLSDFPAENKYAAAARARIKSWESIGADDDAALRGAGIGTIEDFQRTQGLTADGQFGPGTAAKLRQLLNPPVASPEPLPPSGGAPGVVTPAPSIGERSSSYTERAANIEMVSIPAGAFDMGSNNGGADEKPVHRVYVDGFYMGKYEVTQGQWQAVMGNNPSRFEGDNLPMEQVSWDDCQEFIRKLNSMTGKQYRLPTEAEWEYACRAGTTTAFSWGNSISTNQANYDGNYTYGGGSKGVYREKTMPVGSFGANPWGLYDMHGNVWEWCQDWYGSYSSGDERNPTGASGGASRVNRGGSWFSSPRFLRSAIRTYGPGYRDNDLGFRLVRSP